MMKKRLISLLACVIAAMLMTSCDDNEYPSISVTYPYVKLYVDGVETDYIEIENEVGATRTIAVSTNQDESTIRVMAFQDEDADDESWLDISLDVNTITIKTLSKHTDLEEDREIRIYAYAGQDYSVEYADVTVNQSAIVKDPEEDEDDEEDEESTENPDEDEGDYDDEE